jgi:hypothetical protein
VKVTGNFQGGDGEQSGLIGSGGVLARVTVGGALVGGLGLNSGQIFSSASNLGPVKIAGNVQGGPGEQSGQINIGSAPAGVTVGGALVGGVGTNSGRIVSFGNLGPVKIAGNIQGGGDDSGVILVSGTLAGVTVGGALVGGSGGGTGLIGSTGNLGPVKIAGDVQGGGGLESGRIFSDLALASVTVGGALVGGSGNRSGELFSKGNLGPVKIAGNVVGGSVSGVASLDRSGYVQGQRIASVFVGGSIIAGTNTSTGALTKSGSIRAEDDLGPIAVKGGLVGNATNPVILSARGRAGLAPDATTDLAIASLTVGGRVEFASILAGYDEDLDPVNADAQIGAVAVGTDWIASDLVAGVAVGGDLLFGTPDDDLIVEAGGGDPDITARIASIRIKGQALSTLKGGDHFGFVARQVGSLRLGDTLIPLTPGGGNDLAGFPVGATGDLTVNEV